MPPPLRRVDSQDQILPRVVPQGWPRAITQRPSRYSGLLVCVVLAVAGCGGGGGGNGGPPVLPASQNVPILDPLPLSTSATEIEVSGRLPGLAPTGTMVRGRTGLEDVLVLAVGQRFELELQLEPDKVNSIYVTSVSPGGEESAVAKAKVRQDSGPPLLFIDSPADGSQVTEAKIAVTGRVSDLLSGFMGLDVSVNGIPAVVHEGLGSNGTFVAHAVPVNTSSIGIPTTLTAIATDAVGNQVVESVQVTFDAPPPGSPALTVLSGENQVAEAGSELAAPISVLVVQGNGAPFANKFVTFAVTRNDGLLSAASGGAGARTLHAATDAAGVASAYWRLGSDAGCGNNRLVVSSTGVWGTPTVLASGEAAPPKQINIGSGNNQVTEVGAPAPEPLRVWVSDGCNGVAGVEVEFEVVQGGGTVDGVKTASAKTGPTGHAEVSYKAGLALGNNVVEATVAALTTNPARFTIRVVQRDAVAPTAFIATIFDNASQPIENAVCELLDLSGTLLGQEVSGMDGRVHFASIAYQGPAHLHVDGSTATSVGGRPVPPGSFPSLEYEVVVTPNTENRLGTSVLLPRLRPENIRYYSTSVDTVLEVADIEGLRMVIAPGSMSIDGQPAPHGTALALNQVHHDDIPMPMPNGAAPPFAWTLKPAGATFNPPIRIEYPNMSGLPPGAISYFLSFDHDIGEFGIVATAAVSDDGMFIITDEGSGLAKAGWGGSCPPYAIAGDVKDCRPKSNGCGAQSGFSKGFLTPKALNCFRIFGPTGVDTICFTEACDNHDICYGTCNNDKLLCDLVFFSEANQACIDANLGPQSLVVCSNIAAIYAVAIAAGGESAYKQAQVQACMCPAPAHHDGSGIGNGGLNLPFADADGDLLPDDWELNTGLDPADPSDALTDVDHDGLLPVLEYIHGFHPFDPDSLGTGQGDLAEALGIQPTDDPQFDDSWTVSVSGQSAQVDPVGTFLISNVSAQDSFGPSGPGSPPDQLSDDAFRIIAVRNSASGSYYAFTEFFQIQQGVTFTIQNLNFTATPPLLPDFLQVSVPPGTLTSAGQQVQATVIATLGDGSTQDVTPKTAWTTYRTSNPAIAEVDENGVITARGTGGAFITATNGGATAVALVTVDFGATTTVVGFAYLPGGAPAAGAMVVAGLGAPASVALDGSFMVRGVPAMAGPIDVWVGLSGGGTAYVGELEDVPPKPDDVTDVGIIPLYATQVADVIVSSDSATGTIDLFKSDGTKLTALLGGPPTSTIAASRTGDYWVAGGETISRLRVLGQLQVVNQFSMPGASFQGLAVAPDDTLWLTDVGAKSVHQVSPLDGSILYSFPLSSSVTRLRAVVVAPYDHASPAYHVWVASSYGDCVEVRLTRFDSANLSAAPLTKIVTASSSCAWAVWGMAFDPTTSLLWVALDTRGFTGDELDELHAYNPSGSLVQSYDVNVKNTHMRDVKVSPTTGIWAVAGDGNCACNYLFHFTPGLSLCESISLGANVGVSSCWIDGTGQVWASLPGADQLRMWADPSGCMSTQLTSPLVGPSPQDYGDPTGYLLAYVVFPFEDFDGDGALNRAEVLAGDNPFSP